MKSKKSPQWDYSEAEAAEVFFLALAARKYHGQQQSPIHCTINANDEDSDSDTGASTDEQESDDLLSGEGTGRSSMPVRSSADQSHGTLKQKFLDSFAEIVARKKDPGFVSCAALVEEGAKATIYVSRNSGFTKHDLEIFSSLSACMADIGKGGCAISLSLRHD